MVKPCTGVQIHHTCSYRGYAFDVTRPRDQAERHSRQITLVCNLYLSRARLSAQPWLLLVKSSSTLPSIFASKPPSLKIREEICRGAYGSVHFGELDGRPVAVKRIHGLLLEAARGQGDFEKVMTDFKRECQLLEKLHYPHVVDFQGAFYDETTDEPLLVMERMRENLREFLKRNRNDLSQQKTAA